jgi:hypothetical protein
MPFNSTLDFNVKQCSMFIHYWHGNYWYYTITHVKNRRIVIHDRIFFIYPWISYSLGSMTVWLPVLFDVIICLCGRFSGSLYTISIPVLAEANLTFCWRLFISCQTCFLAFTILWSIWTTMSSRHDLIISVQKTYYLFSSINNNNLILLSWYNYTLFSLLFFFFLQKKNFLLNHYQLKKQASKFIV